MNPPSFCKCHRTRLLADKVAYLFSISNFHISIFGRLSQITAWMKCPLYNTHEAMVNSREFKICTRVYTYMYIRIHVNLNVYIAARGGGLGSRTKKMYGERLGDGVEYHSMETRCERVYTYIRMYIYM